jgi:hypothetical protein
MRTGAPPSTAAVPHVKSLNCPSCGATLTVRSFNNAVTIVCGSCHTILDAKDPNLQILQKFQVAAGDDKPLIPLGTRGKIRGTEYEVIGFQRRTIQVEGIPYSWHEYLLFNPYKGFRYLTEYDGHWNDTSTLRSLPTTNYGLTPSITYLGERYKHFQTSLASTTFVLGEFPWQVRVGEAATVTDYISPPRVISSEQTGKEITWSMGEYMSGNDVWKAFSLKGSPPAARGIYENQPSPVGGMAKAIWLTFSMFMVALVALFIALSAIARDDQVFQGDYVFNANRPQADTSFVSNMFTIQGHTSNVEVRTVTDVANNWIYLNYALINSDTGQAFDFGREVSYYHGYDSDGSWSEGNASDSVIVPGVPEGRYYLRVEPEGNTGAGPVRYSVSVKRDVPNFTFYGIAFLALLAPAILITWRSISFENMRWAESDHPRIKLPSGGDDD